MSIPLATTTITVSRPSTSSDDYYDVRTAGTVVALNVRAHISEPSGIEGLIGGRTEQTRFPFNSDICDVGGNDLVTDDVTGDIYEVIWVRKRLGLGVDHMTGQLRIVTGVGA